MKNMKSGRRLWLALTVLLLLVLAGAGAVGAQSVKEPHGWIVAKRLTVETQASIAGDAAVGGTLAVAGASALTGNTSIAGTLAVNGSDLVVAAQLAVAPQTIISVTNGGVLTPTGTLQLIQAAGAVTPTLAAPGSGDLVTILNTANVAILLKDTTGQALAGDATLGQWDSLTIVGYGNSWYELARSNN